VSTEVLLALLGSVGLQLRDFYLWPVSEGPEDRRHTAGGAFPDTLWGGFQRPGSCSKARVNWVCQVETQHAKLVIFLSGLQGLFTDLNILMTYPSQNFAFYVFGEKCILQPLLKG